MLVSRPCELISRPSQELIAAEGWPLIDSLRVHKVSAKFDVWAWALVVLELLAVPLPHFPDKLRCGPYKYNSMLKAWYEAVGVAVEKKAPQNLRNLLVQCCSLKPSERPEFSKIIDYMSQCVEGDYAAWVSKRGGYNAETIRMQEQIELQAFDLFHDHAKLGEFSRSSFGWDFSWVAKTFQTARSVLQSRTYVLLSIRNCKTVRDVQACAVVLAEAVKKMPLAELKIVLQTEHVYEGKKPELIQQLMNAAAQLSEEDIANILQSHRTDATNSNVDLERLMKDRFALILAAQDGHTECVKACF